MLPKNGSQLTCNCEVYGTKCHLSSEYNYIRIVTKINIMLIWKTFSRLLLHIQMFSSHPVTLKSNYRLCYCS